VTRGLRGGRVAVRHDLVYVLNAENGGSVHGYRVRDGRLVSVPGSSRPLGWIRPATPQFTNTPGRLEPIPEETP
jgi:hypothetical protein